MKISLYQKNLTTASLDRYISQLTASGKSANTIDKYTRELTAFLEFVSAQSEVCADIVVRFRQSQMQAGRAEESAYSYARRAYNFCRWLGLGVTEPETCRHEDGVREITPSGQLTGEDYRHLIRTGIDCGMEQTVMMLQVLAGTQMRYSDMASLTVEALRDGGVVEYKSQGENSRAKREHIPERLAKALLQYADRHDITSGMIFWTSNGTFPNRSNVWHSMKRLCDLAGVDPEMVSPQKIKKAVVTDVYTPYGERL